VAGVLVATVLLAVPVKYVVNDDPSFAMILSGADGFSASADLPFLSRILSQALSSLYSLTPTVPWYGIFLYASACLGLGLWLTVPVALGVSRLRTVILIIGWCPYLLFGLYNISMTSVTLWLQLGTFLHLLAWLRSDRSWRISSPLIAVALVLGYLWRWEMFLVFAAFGLPLFLFAARHEMRRCVPVLLVICLVVMGDRAWDFMVTGGADHQQYRTFNRVRGRFHDRAQGGRHQGTPAVLKKVGWTENDYVAYHDLWMLYDEDAVSEQRLRAFLGSNKRERKAIGDQIRQRLTGIVLGNKMVLPAFGFSCLALMVLFVSSWSFQGSHRWRAGASLLGVGVMAGAVCYVRFVSRVSFPLFVYILGLIVVLGETAALRSVKGGRFGFDRMIAVIFTVVGMCLTTTWARVDASALRTEDVQRKFVRASLGEFLDDVDGSPVLIQLDPGVAMVHVGGGPLTERLGDRRIRIVPTGWAMRSPRYQDALSELKVETGMELLKRALKDPEVVFVLYARPWDEVGRVVETWETYYTEHFGQQAEAVYRLEPTRVFESAGYQLRFYRMVAD